MKRTTHLRIVSQGHPALASGQTIWSFLSLFETLQGIASVFLGQSGQWVQLFGSLLGLAGSKGG